MANHELPELLTQLEQASSTSMRKVEKTDDVDADFINPLFRQLLINDKFAFEKMKSMMAMNFVNNLLKTTDKNLLNAINELFDRIVQNSNLINQKSPSNHSHSNYLEKGNGITSASQIYNKTQVDAMIRQLQQNGITSQQIEQMITASILLTKLKSVDGSNSGLDADLLDGFHASDFLRANGKAHDSYKLEGKPSSYYATSARVEQLFQSAVDGKQAHINRINALLGYNSGLTINNSWNDILWHWEHNVLAKRELVSISQTTLNGATWKDHTFNVQCSSSYTGWSTSLSRMYAVIIDKKVIPIVTGEGISPATEVTIGQNVFSVRIDTDSFTSTIYFLYQRGTITNWTTIPVPAKVLKL